MAQNDFPDALIGKTGFVGGILAAQHDFPAQFNRANIHQADGQNFGTVVCAAAPGSMFAANRDPEGDAAAIDAVISALSGIKATRVVLISTIAVLAKFDGQDSENTTEFQALTPYGQNRRRLEAFCADHFDTSLILRLPALYGPGLRKNFIFDIMNPVPAMLTADRMAQIADVLPAALRDSMSGLYDNDPNLGLYMVNRPKIAALPERATLENALIEAGFSARAFTNPDSTFQYYDMTQLWSDICRAAEAGIDLLHLAPAPLRAGDVHAHLTGQTMAPNNANVHHEDMHSLHGGLWEQTGPYIAAPDQVLAGLGAFYAAERGQETL